MELLRDNWHWFVAAADLALALAASAHVVLYKRDARSAVSWVGVIWLTPLIGSLLYYLFGINRIRRRARRMRRRRGPARHAPRPGAVAPRALDGLSPAEWPHLESLGRLVGEVTGQALLPGNRVQMLRGGAAAYPAMLQAIQSATTSVGLSTYIFDNDTAGALFVTALRDAAARGVAVRVLVDGIGVHYSWPTILRTLRRAGVTAASFLPKLLPGSFAYANLCNHRKVLVVDGRVGFTGGMNIRAGHDASLRPRHPIQDTHFRLEGPAVTHLQTVFADDWEFASREPLHGDAWFPKLEPCGPTLARGVSSGPDDEIERMRLVYLGALNCARKSVRIMTPYFLPDPGLVAALNVAALRGVEVDILLPAQNNLRLVQWASTGLLPQVLEHGCRVWLVPPPFDHSKLMLVDAAWVLLGSANWDPRSLRLNFEFDVECYDTTLAAELESLVLDRRAAARRLTPDELNRRSLPLKLRDGVARLLTPYL